jgi:Tol biopolymer transport system component
MTMAVVTGTVLLTGPDRGDQTVRASGTATRPSAAESATSSAGESAPDSGEAIPASDDRGESWTRLRSGMGRTSGIRGEPSPAGLVNARPPAKPTVAPKLPPPPVTLPPPTPPPSPRPTPPPPTGGQGGDHPTPSDTRVAFLAHRDGRDGIFVMNEDGGGLRHVVGDVSAGRPSWSPDKRMLAFSARVETATDDRLFIVNADGSGRRVVPTEGRAIEPAWSPDGSRLAFLRVVDGDRNIFTVRLDGSGLQRVTSFPGTYPAVGPPDWSPDGRRLVFVGPDQGNHGVIYIANADGSGLRQVGPRLAYTPRWSPDGRHIAYVTTGETSEHRYDIRLIAPDGSEEME